MSPGAAAWALESGLGLLPGPLATLGWGLVATVLALAITPFQAAVVARQFLHRMAWRTEVDDSDLAHGLPDGPPPRPVRPSLLPAALLPGLLFSGVVLVNPFGWLEVAETNVTESWQPTERSGSSDNDPELRPFDLRDVHPGRGTGLTMVIDGFEDYASLLACPDISCRKTTFTWAEPPNVNTDAAPGAVSALLPDGRLLLTTWSHQALRLLTCEADKCVPAPGSRNIAERTTRRDTPGWRWPYGRAAPGRRLRRQTVNGTTVRPRTSSPSSSARGELCRVSETRHVAAWMRARTCRMLPTWPLRWRPATVPSFPVQHHQRPDRRHLLR